MIAPGRGNGRGERRRGRSSRRGAAARDDGARGKAAGGAETGTGERGPRPRQRRANRADGLGSEQRPNPVMVVVSRAGAGP